MMRLPLTSARSSTSSSCCCCDSAGVLLAVARNGRAGSAYVFLMYVIQLVWTVFGAGIFLVGDRKALSQLSHTPGLGEDAPASMVGEMLGSEPPPSLDRGTSPAPNG